MLLVHEYYPRRRRFDLRSPSLPPLPPPRRVYRLDSRLRSGVLSETSANGRRRVYDLDPRSEGRTVRRPLVPAISARLEVERKRSVAAQRAIAATADRRLWHPEGAQAPLVNSYGNIARVGAGLLAFKGEALMGMHLARHLSLQLCVQRKARREVLFALHRAGGGHKPPNRKSTSSIRC